MANKNNIGKSTPAKSQKTAVASVKTSKAPDTRPWYQMKRIAFPAIGLVTLSLFAIAFGLIQSQPGSSSADSKKSGASASPSASPSAGQATDGGETGAQAPLPAQPAPPPPQPQAAAPQPSGRAPAAQAVAPTETESQFYARDDALYYWSENWTSRTGLVNWLMGVGHTYEDAAYGADALLVDWSEEALGTANFFMGEDYYSRQTLAGELLAQGFSPAESDYAVNSYDWYDEAFYFAYDLVQSLGYTEEEAYNELINYGFTSDEAVYGSYYAVN